MPAIKTEISIGQVKRDISELLNRVAYGNEHIILTSRGKPKAVIISVPDYEGFTEEKDAPNWEIQLKEIEAYSAQVKARRKGDPIDTESIINAVKDEAEKRHDWLFND